MEFFDKLKAPKALQVYYSQGQMRQEQIKMFIKKRAKNSNEIQFKKISQPILLGCHMDFQFIQVIIEVSKQP